MFFSSKKKLKDNLFFLHLPKCAGTSFNKAMSKIVPGTTPKFSLYGTVESAKIRNNLSHELDDNFESVLNIREELLIYFMSSNAQYIGGHYSFSDIAYDNFKEKYKFITILRNPVDAFISHYFFSRYQLKREHLLFDGSIKEFIDSKYGKQVGSLFVQRIGGVRKNSDYTSEKAIENAFENLKKFDLVGFKERMSTFEEKINKLFNINLKIETKNKNPKSKEFINKKVTSDIREEIKVVCEADIKLYNMALKEFRN